MYKERFSPPPPFQEKRSKITVNAVYRIIHHCNIFPDLVVITFIAVETKVLSGARNCAVHYSLDSGGGGGGFSIYLRAKRTTEIVGTNLWADIKLALAIECTQLLNPWQQSPERCFAPRDV